MVDRDVASMFNQMMGAGDNVDVDICYPKYAEVCELLVKLIKCVDLLAQSPLLKMYSGFHAQSEQLAKFVVDSRAELAQLFPVQYTEHQLATLTPEQTAKFSTIYTAVKESKLINQFIVTCDNLMMYRKQIDEERPQFMLNMSIEFRPFVFSSIDFKQLFMLLAGDAEGPQPRAGRAKQMTSYAMKLIKKICETSYDLYKAMSKPDIDMDEFVSVITANLDTIRKRIPRCDKAFAKIEESVSLLKTNFTTYYKDFITTKNTSTIMESFVLDVAKDTKADAETTRQFQTIIKQYRSLAANSIKNPRVKMMFDKMNEQFESLSEYTNLAKVAEDEASATDESSDESTDESSDDSTGESETMQARAINSKLTVDELVKHIG